MSLVVKAYDVSKVIESYKMEILTALYATVLTAGQGGGGSFTVRVSTRDGGYDYHS